MATISEMLSCLSPGCDYALDGAAELFCPPHQDLLEASAALLWAEERLQQLSQALEPYEHLLGTGLFIVDAGPQFIELETKRRAIRGFIERRQTEMIETVQVERTPAAPVAAAHPLLSCLILDCSSTAAARSLTCARHSLPNDNIERMRLLVRRRDEILARVAGLTDFNPALMDMLSMVESVIRVNLDRRSPASHPLLSCVFDDCRSAPEEGYVTCVDHTLQATNAHLHGRMVFLREWLSQTLSQGWLASIEDHSLREAMMTMLHRVQLASGDSQIVSSAYLSVSPELAGRLQTYSIDGSSITHSSGPANVRQDIEQIMATIHNHPDAASLCEDIRKRLGLVAPAKNPIPQENQDRHIDL